MNNAETIAKLKKGLDNQNIPENVKEQIRKQIEMLEKKQPQQKPPPERKPKAKAEKPASAPSNAKKSVFALAKEIRKPGQSWKDAQDEARRMINDGKKEKNDTNDSEIRKLLALIRRHKSLRGIKATGNTVKDSKRKASAPGKRTAADGSIYYENRPNRSDRLAGDFPKGGPYLEGGGPMNGNTSVDYTDLVGETGAMSSGELFSHGGSVRNERKHVNKNQKYEVRYASDKPKRKGYKGRRNFEDGGVLHWQDAQTGDSAKVKGENKTGVIIKGYGRKFHLRFVDGSEQTFDKDQLQFIAPDMKMFGGFSSAKKSALVQKQYPTTSDRYVHILAHDQDKNRVQVIDMNKLGTGTSPDWISVDELVLPSGMKFDKGGKVSNPSNQKQGKRQDNFQRATQIAKQHRLKGESWSSALSRAWTIIKAEK